MCLLCRLVITATGGCLCEDQDGGRKKGDILREWIWKKPLEEAIVVPVNRHSSIHIRSQQEIILKFTCEAISLEFDIGEKRSRTDSYLTRVRETVDLRY